MFGGNGRASNRLVVGRGTDAGSGDRMPHSRSWRGVSMRVRWFAGLGLVVAVLVAAYALIATPPLQAQMTPQTTTTTLVSNLLEPVWCYVFAGSALSFQTGDHPGGYSIHEVRLMVFKGSGRTTDVKIREDNS